MRLLDFGNRPAAWLLRTLQWWCDRYLILPQDAEALAVQLSTGTAVLKDTALKTDTVNEKLVRVKHRRRTQKFLHRDVLDWN